MGGRGGGAINLLFVLRLHPRRRHSRFVEKQTTRLRHCGRLDTTAQL